MSAVSNAPPVGLHSTAIVPAGTAFSFSARWYLSGVPTAPTTLSNTLFYRGDDPVTSYAQYVWLGTGQDSSLYLFVGASGAIPSNIVLALGWHSIVYTYNPVTFRHKVYIDGSLSASARTLAPHIDYVQNINAFAFTDEYVCTDTYAEDALAWKVAYVREWAATLTDTEANREPVSPVVVKTASLWRDTPLASDLMDISGNARHWAVYP